MTGLSTIGSISLGIALVWGRNRVPNPAAGITAFLILEDIPFILSVMHCLCQFGKMGIAMKRRVFFIILFFLLLSWPVTQAQADCQIGPGKQFTTQVTFYGNKDNGSSIAVGSVTRFRPPAQCTSPIASNTYTISCDEATETL